jgi:hypothetical protein
MKPLSVFNHKRQFGRRACARIKSTTNTLCVPVRRDLAGHSRAGRRDACTAIHEVISGRHPRCATRRIFLVLAAAIPIWYQTAGTALAQRAGRGIEVENIRVGFDSSLSVKGASNSFKIGTWTPVWLQLRAGNERFKGFMRLLAGDDDGTPTSFQLPVEVGANQSERLTAYARPGSRDPDFTVQLFDENGRRVANIPEAVLMRDPPVASMPDETVILYFGQPNGLDGIAGLQGFKSGGTATDTDPGQEIVTARVDVQGGMMPGRWYGYDAAQVIVVDSNDREVVGALDNLRGKPLIDWVERGGHLVVSVGSNWQAVHDSVLGPILPGEPNGRERVTSIEGLESFAGSNKQITPPGSPAVQVTRFEHVEERGGRVLSWKASLPLVIRGAYGFGRVTVIGLDLDQKPFSAWPDRALFWARALDLRPQRTDPANSGGKSGGGSQFYQTGVSDLSSQLRVALEQFPGVRLIPFGWVAFFIFLYILLIGPGDYFFLKKVLKRMELTWITFPTIVVVVSLVAYYAAYLLKGNDLLVNKVDLVDIDQPAGVARGWTWISLFSPHNRDYGIRAIPLLLDREVPPETSPSPAPPRPPAGTEVVTSWYSAPEDRLGAMGNSGRRFSFVGGGYAYEPMGGVEWLDSLRIPIWSTKCVCSRWFGPANPLVRSDLKPAGPDRLAGTVTNLLTVPLKDAILAYGKQMYLLGDMAQGATIRVELSNDRALSGYLKDKQSTYLSATYSNSDARISRPDLMFAIMFHNSESNLPTDRTLANDPLHELDLTGQLALKRPMLVARIDRPGARLVLDGPAPSPKIDQSTMVRVILPLKPSKE